MINLFEPLPIEAFEWSVTRFVADTSYWQPRNSYATSRIYCMLQVGYIFGKTTCQNLARGSNIFRLQSKHTVFISIQTYMSQYDDFLFWCHFHTWDRLWSVVLPTAQDWPVHNRWHVVLILFILTGEPKGRRKPSAFRCQVYPPFSWLTGKIFSLYLSFLSVFVFPFAFVYSYLYLSPADWQVKSDKVSNIFSERVISPSLWAEGRTSLGYYSGAQIILIESFFGVKLSFQPSIMHIWKESGKLFADSFYQISWTLNCL